MQIISGEGIEKYNDGTEETFQPSGARRLSQKHCVNNEWTDCSFVRVATLPNHCHYKEIRYATLYSFLLFPVSMQFSRAETMLTARNYEKTESIKFRLINNIKCFFYPLSFFLTGTDHLLLTPCVDSHQL